MSSYTLFWSPNTYDGRYLLPLVATLGIGTAFFLDWTTVETRVWRKNAWLWSFSLGALVSLFFAWESAATNFAPNISGEHRWSPAELFRDFRITADSSLDAFVETFPNVYNIHVLFVLALVLYGAAYLTYGGITAFRRWIVVHTPIELNYKPGWQPDRAGAGRSILKRSDVQSLSYVASAALIMTGLALFIVSLSIFVSR
jgi:hypothetical protein